MTSVEDFSFRKERVFDENGQSQRVWGVGVRVRESKAVRWP